ncbi:MAG: hypothetical protein A3G87_04755 [Omnitrophica bacterium RIFCSPLOWO2_12_FULL_50_11]|nr:MAG: hypothetical protein A3G87_04755 [Omnitrophica bacterium RIFCSPLOWO2_12_FULL_50_11]
MDLMHAEQSTNRLIQATRPLQAQENETFSYDEAGNQLQRDGDSEESTFDPANRLIEDSALTYTYDRNGNLTQKKNKSTSKTTTYSYDAENQLIRIDFHDGTLSEYRYDGLGRRTFKHSTHSSFPMTRSFIYDGEDILFEFDGTNTLLARYTHGPGIDEPLVAVSYQPSVVSHFYLTDGLGSITELTDSQGQVVQSYLYDSFGNVTGFDSSGSPVPPSSFLSPYLFTSREFDTESGLYYFRARYYDSSIGRFIQEERIFGDDVHPTQKYSYVSGSPVNFIDPFGDTTIAIGGAIGAPFGPIGFVVGVVIGIAVGVLIGKGLGAAGGFCRLLAEGAKQSFEDDYPTNPDDWVPPPGVHEELKTKQQTGGKHRQWKDGSGRVVRRWDRGTPGAPVNRGRTHWHDHRWPGRHIFQNR